MFKDNLLYLRKMKRLSQEDLAAELGVSRQTLSKWETGDALPDIDKCQAIALFFGVSMDDLVSHSAEALGMPVPPRGKHAFGIVTVGDKGQIVIPAKARRIFGIQPGDALFVLGDENSGLALLKEKDFLAMLDMMKKA